MSVLVPSAGRVMSQCDHSASLALNPSTTWLCSWKTCTVSKMERRLKKKSEFLAVGEQHQSLTQISAYMVEKHIVGTSYFGPVTTTKVLSGKRHTLLSEYSLIFKKVSNGSKPQWLWFLVVVVPRLLLCDDLGDWEVASPFYICLLLVNVSCNSKLHK